MYIQKVMKPKDAVRINSEQDIPDFLKDTIKVEDSQITCLAAEGYNHSALGSVIGFDRDAPTETGKGAWPLGENSFIEKDGVFYPAPEIRTAETIEPPFSLETPWGTQTLEEGQKGYLVTAPNGGQNILTLGTTSAADYMVCTEHGQNICSLPEYAEQFPQHTIAEMFQHGNLELKCDLVEVVDQAVKEAEQALDKGLNTVLDDFDENSPYFTGRDEDGTPILDESKAMEAILADTSIHDTEVLDSLKDMKENMLDEIVLLSHNPQDIALDEQHFDLGENR